MISNPGALPTIFNSKNTLCYVLLLLAFLNFSTLAHAKTLILNKGAYGLHPVLSEKDRHSPSIYLRPGTLLYKAKPAKTPEGYTHALTHLGHEILFLNKDDDKNTIAHELGNEYLSGKYFVAHSNIFCLSDIDTFKASDDCSLVGGAGWKFELIAPNDDDKNLLAERKIVADHKIRLKLNDKTLEYVRKKISKEQLESLSGNENKIFSYFTTGNKIDELLEKGKITKLQDKHLHSYFHYIDHKVDAFKCGDTKKITEKKLETYRVSKHKKSGVGLSLVKIVTLGFGGKREDSKESTRETISTTWRSAEEQTEAYYHAAGKLPPVYSGGAPSDVGIKIKKIYECVKEGSEHKKDKLSKIKFYITAEPQLGEDPVEIIFELGDVLPDIFRKELKKYFRGRKIFLTANTARQQEIVIDAIQEKIVTPILKNRHLATFIFMNLNSTCADDVRNACKKREEELIFTNKTRRFSNRPQLREVFLSDTVSKHFHE